MRRQPASQGHTTGHHASYWTPVPFGTSQVNIRARGTGPGAPHGNHWYVRDITIFAGMPQGAARPHRRRVPGGPADYESASGA